MRDARVQRQSDEQSSQIVSQTECANKPQILPCAEVLAILQKAGLKRSE